MKKSVILNTEQVKRLQETGTVAVVELVKPQSDGIRESPFVKSGIETIHGYEIKAPYPQGQQVYVREKWVKGCDWDGLGDMPPYKFGYQGSEWVSSGDWYDGNREDGIALAIPWKSAATMPKSAARLFPIVASEKVVRVKELSNYQLVLVCGHKYGHMVNYSMDFTNACNEWLIAKFGQSAWDNNAFIFITTFKIEK